MLQKVTKSDPLDVLVVDDELVVCQSVEKVLRRKGHRVEQALSVAAALSTMDEGKMLDLIIADLMMPQAGGLDLLKAIRESWPDVPVLIITGFSSIRSAVESTKLGAAGYLPKPFTPDELEKAVEGVVVQGPWKAAKAAAADDSEEIIDVDMPFNPNELEKATSASYVAQLTRSDMPIVKAKPIPPADYCSLGQRSCKKFAAKGICQKDECPIITAENKRGRAAASTEYVFDPIDVDLPFSISEVVGLTSEEYVAALGRSDMPIVGHWAQFAPAAQNPKVLVVDDEAVVVNSIRKTLARKGFAVEAAYNCKDALAQILLHNYDLVLLDMRMSDGNGLDLLPRIKNQRPNLRVVVVTGYASIDTAVEAIRKGASDYMPKPFTPDELYSMTDRVLGAAVA
jgi:DNA-binding NtrC family response regulator